MKNPERLIGRKVYGFKFETNESDTYNPKMNNHIGELHYNTSVKRIKNHISQTKLF